MGLIIPSGPDWAYCTHNFPSSVNAEALGAAVTSSGTANTDGTAVDLFGAALSHDVEYLRLSFSAAQASGANNDALATILIDPAGGTSWSTLIPFLICGPVNDIRVSGGAPAGQGCFYDFPIWIPSGATVGCQIRANNTSGATWQVLALAHGGNANPASWWCGQRVSAIGVTEAASDGTTVAPGTSGSFGSWADVGSTLGADAGAIQYGLAGVGGSFALGAYWEYEFGVGDVRIGPPVFRIMTTDEAGWWIGTGPIFKRIAAGAQIRARGREDGADGQSLSAAAWAVH